MVSLVGFLLFLTKRTQPCFLVVVIKGVLPIGCLMFDTYLVYSDESLWLCTASSAAAQLIHPLQTVITRFVASYWFSTDLLHALSPPIGSVRIFNTVCRPPIGLSRIFTPYRFSTDFHLELGEDGTPHRSYKITLPPSCGLMLNSHFQ
jgi:hypothetical protein